MNWWEFSAISSGNLSSLLVGAHPRTFNEKELEFSACDISVNDHEMKDDEVSIYMKCPSLPPTVDGCAIADDKPPILTSPPATIVDRTSTSIRAPVFNNGFPNPRRSHTQRIPRREIQLSRKDLTRQQQEERRYRSSSSSRRSTKCRSRLCTDSTREYGIHHANKYTQNPHL